MYILRHDATKSVAEIQRLFGNRDHSTVLGAIARIEGERGMEPGTAADLAAVREAIAVGRVVVSPAKTTTIGRPSISVVANDR